MIVSCDPPCVSTSKSASSSGVTTAREDSEGATQGRSKQPFAWHSCLRFLHRALRLETTASFAFS